MAEELKPDLTVPLSVLDRFLQLSQENNAAYGAMVSAVDAMSSKILELNDQMELVRTTIDKEQLAKVVRDATEHIKNDITTLSIAVKCFGEPQYNVLYTTSECLAHAQAEKKEVQELATALIWVLGVVAVFKRRRFFFVFLLGIAVTLIGVAGEGAKSVIKIILGLL